MNYEMLLATHNKHKLQEVRKILSPHKITVYGLDDLLLKPEFPEETADTYAGNALIKAEAIQKLTTFPIIADDSGLEIEAMDNKPGIHSARFAEEKGGHSQAIQYILDYLKDKSNRKATFHCDIILLNVEDKPLLFEGIVEGEIAYEAKGDTGFGYDPIFFCKETGKTYAEMGEEEKNKASHRAKALKKMITYLKITGKCI